MIDYFQKLFSLYENMVHSLNELVFIDHDKSNDDNKSCNKSEVSFIQNAKAMAVKKRKLLI